MLIRQDVHVFLGLALTRDDLQPDLGIVVDYLQLGSPNLFELGQERDSLQIFFVLPDGPARAFEFDSPATKKNVFGACSPARAHVRTFGAVRAAAGTTDIGVNLQGYSDSGRYQGILGNG